MKTYQFWIVAAHRLSHREKGKQPVRERLWYRCNRSLKRLPRSPPLLNAIISWEELPRSLRWLQQQTKAKGAQESVAHYNLIRFIHRVIKSRLELPPGRSHQHRPKRFLERARARGSPLSTAQPHLEKDVMNVYLMPFQSLSAFEWVHWDVSSCLCSLAAEQRERPRLATKIPFFLFPFPLFWR